MDTLWTVRTWLFVIWEVYSHCRLDNARDSHHNRPGKGVDLDSAFVTSVVFLSTLLSPVTLVLARIFHQLSAATADMLADTALHSVGLLDVLFKHALRRPLSCALFLRRPLHRFANDDW